MSYSPPPGSAIVLPFPPGPYSPPPGGALTLEFAPPEASAIYPPSIESATTFGTTDVATPLKFSPLGIESTAVVSTFLGLAYPLHQPDGIPSTLAFGEAYVWLKQLFVDPYGIEPPFFPLPQYVADPHFYWPIPPGDGLVLNFVEPYEPPPGDALVLEFHPHGVGFHVRPLGIVSQVFGDALVEHRVGIRAFGIDSQQFGNAFITFVPNLGIWPYGEPQTEFGEVIIGKKDREIYPNDIRDFAVGEPSVKNRAHGILPRTIYTEQWGMAVVRTTWQRVVPIGFVSHTFAPAPLPEDQMRVWSSRGPTQSIFPEIFGEPEEGYYGKPGVTHWRQEVLFINPWTPTLAFGTAWVSLGQRTIFPAWFADPGYGRPTFIATQYLQPYWTLPPEQAFGKPSVYAGNVRFFEGFDSLEMGQPEIIGTQFWHVGETGTMTYVGTPWVHNLNQYVYVKPYLIDGFYGNEASVVNENKQLFGTGYSSAKVSLHHILQLKGRPTSPGGISSMGVGEPIVSNWRRYVEPWGFDSSDMDYNAVHLRDFLVEPLGIPAPVIPVYPPVHRVWDPAQHIQNARVPTDATYGKPFVAFGVRYISQYHSVSFSDTGYPHIELRKRYLEPGGIEPGENVGSHNIRYLPPQEIRPHLLRSFVAGTAHRIANVTPQLYQVSFTPTTYGKPWISHSPRYVYATSVLPPSAAVSKPFVENANRPVYPVGINSLFIPLIHLVRQEEPIDYGPRMVLVHPYIHVDADWIGHPTVNGGPYPVGWDSLLFGKVNTRANNIRPIWEFPSSFFGFGLPVLSNYQTIAPDGFDTMVVVKQRIDPHTIWATLDTPQQARDNHPESLPFHEVDRLEPGQRGELPPWFGKVNVRTKATQHIKIERRPQDMPDFTMDGFYGNANVELENRPIYVLGVLLTKWGFPELNGPRTLWIGAIEAPEFGIGTQVGIVPGDTQYLGPESIGAPFQSLQHLVEHLDRRIYPSGIFAPVFGLAAFWYDPRAVAPEGFDPLEITEEHWISHRNRECPIEGWDSFEEGYTAGQFQKRMRVTRGAPKDGVSVGDSLNMGSPTVSGLTRVPQHIRPYMIPAPELCHPHSVELEEA